MSIPPSDRRPIAARQLRVMKSASLWLARIGCSANGISIAGMAFGVLSGLALGLTPRLPEYSRPLWMAGAVLIQLRLLANLMDGMVAIERGTASKVGELFNEVPDRVSDSATLIGVGCASGGDVLLGFCAALAAVMTAYVRAVGKAAGAPNEYCGPMAKQQRMFLCTLTAIYIAATPAEWQSLPLGCCKAGLPACALAIILVGSVITIARRLGRIGSRLRGAT